MEEIFHLYNLEIAHTKQRESAIRNQIDHLEKLYVWEDMFRIETNEINGIFFGIRVSPNDPVIIISSNEISISNHTTL